jgi:hypothetical protein
MTFGEKLTNYLAKQQISDGKFGALLVPPLTGACVWKWRNDKSEPAKPYRSQIITLTNKHITANDFI